MTRRPRPPHGGKSGKPAPTKPARVGLPSKDDLIAFIKSGPDETSKRDLAKAFGIKGADRPAFKALLRELADEGLIDKPRGKIKERGRLPSVAVIDLIGQDVDGDLLGIPAQWDGDGPAPQVRLLPGGLEKLRPAIGVGERVLARISTDEDGATVAKLMKRIGASAHDVLGVVRRGPDGPRVQPVDRKARHDLKIATADLKGAVEGELVLCELLPERHAGLHRARIKERFGSIDAPNAISLIAIHSHRLPTVFPAGALKEAERAKPAALAGRTDLRDLPLITIDPDDARDHDDAVYAEPDTHPANPGGHVVWVAIADVAHYVTVGSDLDREALRRGNSVYFPDRVVPMLPEALSADLCSLREGEDRACLAVKLIFSADGQKKTHTFVRALMRSAGRLSYSDAQTAMDGTPNAKVAPLMERVLKPLFAAYRTATVARDERSPLDLDLPEHKIKFSADGKVAEVRPRERIETMRLIEEFMIQANVAAAETLEAKHTPLLYRIHDRPDLEKLEALKSFVEGLDLKFPSGATVRARAFNRLIADAKGTDVETMLHEVILRTQSQARYAPENVGHFGLNLVRYAHFTSPIRRYADLVVHRGLIRALGLGEDGQTDAERQTLGETGEKLSTLERRAMAAERDATTRYLAAYLTDRVGAAFMGRISGVTRFGLFVRLEETGADGIIPIRTLGRDYYIHDERTHALIGEATGAVYRLGERVEVELKEAVPVTGGLVFELLSEPQSYAKPGKRGGVKPRNKTAPRRGAKKTPSKRKAAKR